MKKFTEEFLFKFEKNNIFIFLIKENFRLFFEKNRPTWEVIGESGAK
jgi:hypothetical protein